MSPRPYVDSYPAGVGLGLVLLGCFALSGQGLGASGAFASVASHATNVFTKKPWVEGYLSDGWTSWMVVEVGGLIVGAGLSAWLAGRLGAKTPVSSGRLIAATAGSVLMGVGAAPARGCTSGLALSAGAWVFMIALVTAMLGAFWLVRGGCFCNPGAAEKAFVFDRLPLAASLDDLEGRFSIPALRERLGGAAVGALRLSVDAPTIQADLDRALEQIARYRNRPICSSFLFSHRSCGKPASTFPRDASAVGDISLSIENARRTQCPHAA